MNDEIQQAIDNYIQMEMDAEVINLMRLGYITGVEKTSDGWRVDSPTHFYMRPTLTEAVQAALSKGSK
jgi:hypothetical protein